MLIPSRPIVIGNIYENPNMIIKDEMVKTAIQKCKYCGTKCCDDKCKNCGASN